MAYSTDMPLKQILIHIQIQIQLRIQIQILTSFTNTWNCRLITGNRFIIKSAYDTTEQNSE